METVAHKFAEIAFTDSVRRIQEHHGSRKAYARMDAGEDQNHKLCEREASFIAELERALAERAT